MNEYLEFRILEQKPKTLVVGVFSKKSGDLLGRVQWFGRWRRYAFFPTEGTAFDISCIGEIAKRIKTLEEGRLKEKSLESMSLSELMGVYCDVMPGNVEREAARGDGK